jgi:hypothetical protein
MRPEPDLHTQQRQQQQQQRHGSEDTASTSLRKLLYPNLTAPLWIYWKQQEDKSPFICATWV